MMANLQRKRELIVEDWRRRYGILND